MIEGRRRTVAAAVLAIQACAALACGTRDHEANRPPAMPDGRPRIVVDRTLRFQVITGWEAVAEAGQAAGQPIGAYRDDLFDRAVDELGITRLRLEVRSGAENARDYWSDYAAGRLSEAEWRRVRYSTVNDNDDPFTIDWRHFRFSELDATVKDVVLPIKRRLEKNGERLYLNVNYVAFTDQIGGGLQYDHDAPEEYAEFVQATYIHLRQAFGLVPDAWEVELEPDNRQSRHWKPGAMRDAMAAAGRRLQSMGVSPRFIAPSTTNIAHALEYADAIAGRADALRFWSELSYHRYGGASQRTLRAIAARARELGVRTAMLEHIGSGYRNLVADLKDGQVSAWQQFTLAFPGTRDGAAAYYLIDDRDPAHPRITMSATARYLRQYFHYVRPGDTRIGASSSEAALDPVAFENANGHPVVVIAATGRASFAVQGLPRGTYAMSYTTGRETDSRTPAVGVDEGGTLSATIPDSGVLTIYGS